MKKINGRQLPCGLPEKGQELFRLFSCSDNPKLRALAVRIGIRNGYDVSAFESDPNGHVRRAAGLRGV